MSLIIRPALPTEAKLILAMVRELAEYERLSHEVDATEPMIAEALFGPSPRSFCDIADWGGEPAGFALWFLNYSSFRGRHGLYLEDLFVRPAFRRRGIARALFAHLARRCVSSGWTRFEWAVLDWNTAAIGFYREMGAELKDEWTIYRVTGPALVRLAGAGGSR
jgi:GNAT superfamily N-acetyltransferase